MPPRLFRQFILRRMARERTRTLTTVFGIALGRVWQEVEGSLANLPAENAEPYLEARPGRDELSACRRARKTG